MDIYKETDKEVEKWLKNKNIDWDDTSDPDSNEINYYKNGEKVATTIKEFDYFELELTIKLFNNKTGDKEYKSNGLKNKLETIINDLSITRSGGFFMEDEFNE